MIEPSPVDRVVVTLSRTDDPLVLERLIAYRLYLSDDELRRVGRFVHPSDAANFIVGRTLARTLLSRYAELAARPAGTPDLRFNVSHTSGLVACAVTVGREVGVDVEHTGRRLVHDVAERFFSPREVADLRACPAADQPVVFFDYWTLKASYIKARGLGLALPLGQFSFVCVPGRAPTIEFAPELHDDPSSWQFAQFWPTAEHRMAVAVRRSGEDLRIDVTDVIPEGTQ
jgi:4'-phosphopantetheinyl transferase